MAAPDRCSLLIADGEPYCRTALAAVLRPEFEVLTAESGRDAQRILAGRGADLILADVRLPDMTGLRLLESARQ